MANDKYGSTTTVEQTMAGQMPPSDIEDILSGSPASQTAVAAQRRAAAAPAPAESQYAVGEVTGDATVPRGEEAGVAGAGLHEEVGSIEGAEAAEQYFEATPDQLSSAESGEETALSDLRGIEGFEGPISGQEAAAVASQPLREAGEAIEGGQEEFLPFLAALAPTLVSAIGPVVAKGVMSRLSPRARKVVQRLPKAAGQVATAVKGAAGAAAGKDTRGIGALLPLIAKLLQQAQAKPAGESGMESESTTAIVEEAAAVLEVIIGTDDRVRISQTTDLPWRRICALRIQFPSGATYRGTGFLIGPRAVATAGHCVYLHNQGGWARRIEVIPGCNGSTRPFGQVESTAFRSVGGWVSGRKPESDYGCVVLPPNAFGGRNLGSFGFAAFDPQALLAQPAVVAGFPGDKPFAEMWGMARLLKTVSAKTLAYDIDTVGGQSGAPVYVKRNGQRYVVGIHNYGATSGNSATRVTQDVYQRLLGWSRL